MLRPDNLQGEFFAVDTETTGFSPKNADIIEIAAIRCERRNGRFEILDEFDSYVNPQYPLPPKIVEFNEKNHTGITDELLRSCPPAHTVARDFLRFTGERPIVVGHNIVKFDKGFIEKLCASAGRGFIVNDYLDTLLLSREHEPYQERHSLDVCLERSEKRHTDAHNRLYGNSSFHTAIFDVKATLDVLEYLDKEYYQRRNTLFKRFEYER